MIAAALCASAAQADGWRTTVRRIDSPPAADPGPPDPAWRRATPPPPRSAELSPLDDRPFYALRAPLPPPPGGKAELQPYVGAGVRPDDRGGAAALLGGVAAPVLKGAVLYGEVQQLRGGEAEEEERRLMFGLRRGF